jgi:tetratricopeptide (TPR) repeat protein
MLCNGSRVTKSTDAFQEDDLVLLGKSQDQEANPTAERGEGMAREMSPGFMMRARELFDTGKFSAAIMTLQEGLQQYPQFTSARVLLGEIYWTSGEAALARAELEQVINAVPDNFAAHRKLALIYRDAGEVSSAIQSCRSVLHVNPRDFEMRALLDRLQGMQAHAPDTAKAESHAGPPVADSELPLPAVTQELHTAPPVDSESTTTRTARVSESDGIDSETLAELYLIQGHREKGLLVYQRLADKYPENPRYRDRIEALARPPAALERPAAVELPAAVERPEVLEQPAALDDTPPPEPVAVPIPEETPVKNRRRVQVRRLEGWLQVIRTRRRL